jgi:ApbE superfamily uncharacterized protein (UPF0280 family)
MIEPRFYREEMGNNRFSHFTIGYKDSDLCIGIDKLSFTHDIVGFAQNQLIELRKELEEYILEQPEFGVSFDPVIVKKSAPEIARNMAFAGKLAKTGPMAAVAGAIAEKIGKSIQARYKIKEIIVENGGDIYLSVIDDLVFSVYAGSSSLSGKLGIEINASETPLGICTSAGTVGPSISFGKADAVVVVCKDCAIADAYATAIGNKIKNHKDITIELQEFKNRSEILFLLVICEEKLGLQGNFAIHPLKGKNY